jgi:hypothetical protein
MLDLVVSTDKEIEEMRELEREVLRDKVKSLACQLGKVSTLSEISADSQSRHSNSMGKVSTNISHHRI